MKVSKRFLVVLVLFSFMFLTTVALVIRLMVNKGRQPAGGTSSEANIDISPRPTLSFEDVLLELNLLESYYDKNQISLPENYESITNEYEKIARLLNKVFEREITWRSGGFIFISFIDLPSKFEGSEERKRRVLQKIEEYHTRAKNGEKIEVLIEEVNEDPIVDEMNQYLSSQSPRFDLIYKSKSFEKVVREAGIVTPSVEFDEEIFNLNKGEVSDIYEYKLGYMFISITETHNTKFTTYEKWLNAVSAGKLTRSSL